MKKFISISFLLLALCASRAFAGDIVSPLKGQPESWYDVTHSTVAISSTSVSSDAAVQGYRAVYIYNLSITATIYYTLSSSTTTPNVTSLGWPIYPWRWPNTANPIPEKIEYNGQINYRLAAGVASIDVTKKTIRK